MGTLQIEPSRSKNGTTKKSVTKSGTIGNCSFPIQSEETDRKHIHKRSFFLLEDTELCNYVWNEKLEMFCLSLS